MREMKLRLQVLQATRRLSRAACVQPCHWSEGRHNNMRVTAGKRATTQVMLGVSLRARWDATLVLYSSSSSVDVSLGSSKNKVALRKVLQMQ